MKCLQLPKNKFARLAINILFVPVWFSIWVIFYPTMWVNKTLNYLTRNLDFEVYLNIRSAFELITIIIPVIIFTRFISFRGILPRPRITRSNSDRDYGDPEFNEDLILKMEYLEMKERYKSELEE